MQPIAVVVTDLFEDSEYLTPVERFKDAGYPIVNIEIKAGKVVKGKRQQTQVIIDKAVQDVAVTDFVALLIPGGFSPDQLRVHEEMVNFVKDFFNSGKPVFPICHGPQLLITANVLSGRTVTGWKSIIQDLKNAGAKVVDQEVVQDGNLISSRYPGDLEAFCNACLQKLKQT